MDTRINIAVIVGVVFVLAFAVTLTQYENQAVSQDAEFEISDELIWTYLIDPNQLSLSAGEYEVYPYFKIKHSYLPIGLVNALGGTNMFEFDEEYLNLPCDIVAASLTVNKDIFKVYFSNICTIKRHMLIFIIFWPVDINIFRALRLFPSK